MRALFALALLIAALGFSGRGVERAAAQPSLNWKSCSNGFECAALTVPLDYTKPNGQTIDLALIRLPARDPSKRIGSLLINPGGPGAPGVDFARGSARAFSTDIRERFDIVGFDPRGIGGSAPIACHSNIQALVAADPSPDNQKEWDELARQNRILDEECARTAGAILPFVGTKNVARDMDRIRETVGDAKLTYLGFSYGTVIGQVYADMFPTKVRAIVLDGAVDLSLSNEEVILQQAGGFERALNAFLENCRKERCLLARRGDPGAQVDEVIRRSELAPIPAKGQDRPAGPGETILGIISPLYQESQWPELSSALDAALDGDGSGLVRLADDYLNRNRDGSYPNLLEANTAVNCIDGGATTLPTTYPAFVTATPRFTSRAPRFGPALGTGLTCLAWPAKPDPLTAPRAQGAPPIVVVSTTGDPATPYEWGVAVSKQLASGVLVSFGGQGHTAYLGGNSCVDKAVNDYLISLKAPAVNTKCGDLTLIDAANSAAPTPSAVASPSASPSRSGGSPSPAATPVPQAPSTGGETQPTVRPTTRPASSSATSDSNDSGGPPAWLFGLLGGGLVGGVIALLLLLRSRQLSREERDAR